MRIILEILHRTSWNCFANLLRCIYNNWFYLNIIYVLFGMRVIFPFKIWSYEHMHCHWTCPVTQTYGHPQFMFHFCLIRWFEDSVFSILGNGVFEVNECLTLKTDSKDHREATKISNSLVIQKLWCVNIIQLFSKTMRKQCKTILLSLLN